MSKFETDLENTEDDFHAITTLLRENSASPRDAAATLALVASWLITVHDIPRDQFVAAVDTCIRASETSYAKLLKSVSAKA